MKMDTSSITDATQNTTINCVTYRDNTLNVYTDYPPQSTAQNYEFHRLGNSWIHSSTITGETPSGTDKCYTIEQIENFNSPYDFMEPILHTMAIMTALFIFFVAYSLIIKPFVRRV